MLTKTFSPLNIFRNGLGYKAKDYLELEVCLANPHMIATAKCKIPLDLCLENPEWLPLVGCSGEGYPRQVCLDFPNLITSPACEGQNCTPCSSRLCPPLSLPFPLAILFLIFTNTFPPAHHNVYGAFSLEICLRFPSLLPKPACQGQSISLFQGKGKTCVDSNLSYIFPAALDGYEATLFDCQDNKQFFCSRNMCEKHQFIVKC